MKVLINIIFEVLNLSKDIQFLKDPVKVNKSQNEINLLMIFSNQSTPIYQGLENL